MPKTLLLTNSSALAWIWAITHYVLGNLRVEDNTLV